MRVRGLIAAMAGLLMAAPATAGADPFALDRGDAAFWSGGGDGGSCGARCWDYALDVGPGGRRLRIAIDHRRLGDGWTAELRHPAGGLAGTAATGTALYSAEAGADAPDPGRWTVRVTASPSAQDLRFRMRAELERFPVLPERPVAELPNLQALPPWDLSFALPVTDGSADAPQGAAAPGGRVACRPDEVQGSQPVRCLRMAFGVRNTGRGPLELFLGPGAEQQDRPLTQRVRSSDGARAERAAGKAVWDQTQGRYLQDQAVALELLRVGAPGSAPAPAAGERRPGLHLRGELMREWTMFHPIWDLGGEIALEAGWGGYAEWDRPGSFVDFGLNPDGRYVVRVTADPANSVLEANESDNVGYSVIEVAGGQVTLVESGRGAGPGDRCRILTPLGPEPDLPAGLAQAPRPADCPLDTIDPEPPPPPVVSAPVQALPPYVPGAAPATVRAVTRRAAPRRCPRADRHDSRRRRASIRRCRRAEQRRRRAASQRR